MIQNCWDFMQCGRESENTLGICPAVTEARANKINRGKNGGRVCWAVAGTYCDGCVQGSYAQKVITCRGCAFREKVRQEEGFRFRHVFVRR